ncbi:MAG: hypothetical protein NTU41_15210, partial [Chloroflexi bacterium]|nr:hypothetical protein [Chloroflexota bacterium]
MRPAFSFLLPLTLVIVCIVTAPLVFGSVVPFDRDRKVLYSFAQPAVTQSPAQVPLAAMFLSWYGFDTATGDCIGGIKSLHWNNTPNTAGVVDTPAVGFYCSNDPKVVSWQIDQLQQAGIQVLFISWWGWGDTRLDGTSRHVPDIFINKGIAALMDGIAAKNADIKVSLIVEPFTLTQAGIAPSSLSVQQQKSILDWLWSSYYNHPIYSSLMYSWEGKPLLLS